MKYLPTVEQYHLQVIKKFLFEFKLGLLNCMMKTELFFPSMLGERLSLSKKCCACVCNSCYKRILSNHSLHPQCLKKLIVPFDFPEFGVVQNTQYQQAL